MRHFVIQSEVKPKPKPSFATPMFCLVQNTLSFHWLTGLSKLFVIDEGDFIGFYFMKLSLKQL